jgi:hypothetical protein
MRGVVLRGVVEKVHGLGLAARPAGAKGSSHGPCTQALRHWVTEGESHARS